MIQKVVIFFSLQIFVFSVQRGPFEEDFYQCVDRNYPNRQYRKMYNMFSLITQFMIPLGIMIVAYGLIFFTISRKSKEFRGMSILIAINSKLCHISIFKELS